jgi:hypothetical protein
VVDDELTRLRSMLRNAHQEPRVGQFRKLAGLITRKLVSRKKRETKSDESPKPKRNAA